jgi:hypothetical protein
MTILQILAAIIAILLMMLIARVNDLIARVERIRHATVPGEGDLLRSETPTPERPEAGHMEQITELLSEISNQIDMLHQTADPDWARERLKRWLGKAEP